MNIDVHTRDTVLFIQSCDEFINHGIVDEQSSCRLVHREIRRLKPAHPSMLCRQYLINHHIDLVTIRFAVLFE